MEINPVRNSDGTSNPLGIIPNSDPAVERRGISNGVKKMVVGPLMTNCYLLIDDAEMILIDPGEEADLILKEISQHPQKLKYIILTHYHFDHVLAAQKLRKKTNASILIHEKDSSFLEFSADRYLKEAEEIKIGETALKVIHSPGHSKGSICLLADKEIFVGDLIFEEGYGRTDLKGGSEQEMRESLKKISKILKPGMIIYPGHGKIFTILSEEQVDKIGRAMQ